MVGTNVDTMIVSTELVMDTIADVGVGTRGGEPHWVFGGRAFVLDHTIVPARDERNPHAYSRGS
jgi:hypothetical protein